MLLVPVTQFATSAVYFLFFISLFLHYAQLANIAIGIFAVITLFHLVTLPVEFNASRRAQQQLLHLGLIQGDERYGVNRVLSAAAMTYVAALVTALLQLLHWVMIARGDHR